MVVSVYVYQRKTDDVIVSIWNFREKEEVQQKTFFIHMTYYERHTHIPIKAFKKLVETIYIKTTFVCSYEDYLSFTEKH